MLETVIRIRMNNAVDRFALARTIESDEIAEQFLHYRREEYGHDRLIEDDLHAMGSASRYSRMPRRSSRRSS